MREGREELYLRPEAEAITVSQVDCLQEQLAGWSATTQL